MQRGERTALPTDRLVVLVVDDDEGIRTIAKRSLESIAGFIVDTAHDTLEARQRLLECAYDAILIDVLLAGESGFELVEWLQSDGSRARIPVWLFTASDLAGTSEKRCFEGLAGVIAKPFDPLTMPTELKSHLLDGASVSRGPGPNHVGGDEIDLGSLWSKHRSSLLGEARTLYVLLSAMESEVGPWCGPIGGGITESPGGWADSVVLAHRLHGALGVYGRREESDLARTIHHLLASGPAGEHAAACLVLVSRLRALLDDVD